MPVSGAARGRRRGGVPWGSINFEWCLLLIRRIGRGMVIMSVMEKEVLRTTLKDQPVDRDYWLSRSVSERVSAVEQFRLQAYPLSDPDNRAKHRLQRVYRITQLHAG